MVSAVVGAAMVGAAVVGAVGAVGAGRLAVFQGGVSTNYHPTTLPPPLLLAMSNIVLQPELSKHDCS